MALTSEPFGATPEGRAGSSAPLPRGVRLDGSQTWVLTLTRRCLRLLVRLCARGEIEVQGLERIPRQGPLLICSNHLSNFDPLVYGAIVPRVLHVLTKAELFRSPVLGAYLSRCNCIPVRRGEADRVALRGSRAVLRSQGALLLFPEGHRGPGASLLEFQPGAGYLALRSRATVVCCAIWGTEEVLPKGRLWPRRGPITVRFSEPFQPRGGELTEVSSEIRSRVLALLPERYRDLADGDQLDREDEG